jgi:hyperosmotically inducible periplasmic protein
MRKLLLFSSLLALSLAAAGQVGQVSAATPASGPSISSEGPVVPDYGNVVEKAGNSTEAKLAKEVRHELLMLPYYSLFDDLEYSVQGRTVTLSGSVTSRHSQTKQDAERAVKKIEGVENVVNNIKVLPPSPADVEARVRIYRALANTGSLSQYFWAAAPSIHIIVDNLNVTLKGYVDSEGDKNLAGITAKGVSGILSVTNNLQVVKQ